MSKIFDFVKPGVITGDDVQKVFQVAKENNFALPAVNCVGTDSINAVLETAAKVKAPVIVQFSNGGAAFIAGKGVKTDIPQGLLSWALSLVRTTYIRWLSTTVFLLSCTPTTARRNCCRGSTVCWTRVKNTSQPPVNHCSLLT